MRWGLRGTVWLAALVAAVLAGACGTAGGGSATARVDPKQVEALLTRRQVEAHPGLKVESVTCPAGVAAHRGETFDCTVVVEGLAATYAVTIADVLGKEVRYDLQARRAIVDVAGVVAFLRSRLDADWRTAAVDCGAAKAMLVDVGGVVACTVSDGTTIRHIDAVVEDRDGTVELQER